MADFFFAVVDRDGTWLRNWSYQAVHAYAWTPDSRLVVTWDGAELGTGTRWAVAVSDPTDFSDQTSWNVIVAGNDGSPPGYLHVRDDGTMLTYTQDGTVYLQAMDGRSDPRPLVHSSATLAHPMLSPDQDYLAVLAHDVPVHFDGSKTYGPLLVVPMADIGTNGPLFIDPDGEYGRTNPTNAGQRLMANKLHAWLP